MKQFIFIIITFLSLAIGSCSRSNKHLTGKRSATANTCTDNSICFKVNGDLVQTSGWNISRFDMGKGIGLNITTSMHDDKRTIMINIRGDKAGSYSLGDMGTAYGDYKPDYNDLLNAFSFQDGTIRILKIDTVSNRLNATFEGTVKNSEGKTLPVTEGKITNGKLAPGVTIY